MRLEDKIQAAIFQWFQNTHVAPYPKGQREMIFAVPNQNQHKLTAIGVKAGVADLIFSWGVWTVYCEVKTEDGTQSPAQIKFEEAVMQLRSKSIYILVRSLEGAQEFCRIHPKE